MRTAIDSSVLLDVVVDDPAYAESSERALRRVMGEGAVVMCECVVAEIVPAFRGGRVEVEEFLRDWHLEFAPSTQQSALHAGDLFRTYLARRPARGGRRVVADFLIGAHAQAVADRLLARDRGFYRDYFADLVIMEPEGTRRG